MKRAFAPVRLLGVTAAIAGALLFCARADAQITVTSATFPVAGDTLRIAHDDAPGSCGLAADTPPGGPQTWDLSCLHADSTQNIVYRPASEGGVIVPGAQLFAVTSPTFPGTSATTEEYYSATSSQFQLLASYGRHYALVADSVFRLIPPLPQRSAPLNFFDIRAASSGALELFLPSALPPAMTSWVGVDSVRYRVAISQISAVDAFGTLSIPGGSYNVLREKTTKYTEARIDAKILPLGWLDVTDNFISAGFGRGLGVDTAVHYSFYNDVAKEPIATVHLNNAQSAVERATFKAPPPPAGPTLTGLTLKQPVVAGCKPMTGTVTISSPAPTGGITIALSETLASGSLPATVTIPAGATSKAIKVTTTARTDAENGTVSASYGGVTLSKPLQIRPIGVLSIPITPTTLVGGGISTGVVKLECKAAPGPIFVELGSTLPAVASTTVPNVLVPVGVQTAPITVTTSPVTATKKPKITATANGITKSKTLTVTP
jgi:hypothetical protein